MTDMTTTTDLVKRLEAGETGREIDAHIGWHLDGHHTKFCPTPEILLSGMTDFDLAVPHYTTSLDAAVALVERVLPGCWWQVERQYVYDKGSLRAQGVGRVRADGSPRLRVVACPTPAAALIAALIKAKGAGDE